MRRAVVTGLGAVTPLGSTLHATHDALSRGEAADRALTLFDASGFASTNGAEVVDFDARPHFRVPKALKLCDRRTRFAVAASSMALADAGSPRYASERLGVLVGTSGSDLGADELGRALREDPSGRAAHDIPYFAAHLLAGLNPLWLLVHLPNMASAHVAIQLEAQGPNSTVMTGWAAGLQAIGEAAALICEGAADAILAGGAESFLHPFAYAALQQAGFLHKELFVPGEGAAMLLLEERQAALARGARIYGEIHDTASGARSAAELVPCDTDRLATQTGHLFAALAPLHLALVLLDGENGATHEVSAVGPSGEWATLTATAERTIT